MSLTARFPVFQVAKRTVVHLLQQAGFTHFALSRKTCDSSIHGLHASFGQTRNTKCIPLVGMIVYLSVAP